MKITIGIDEVGRGPLAGPVVVCALAIQWKAKSGKLKAETGLPLRDSKKLSARQREVWCAWIKMQPNIQYALARVYPKTIDRINISEAANLAATRALVKAAKLISSKVDTTIKVSVLLDGGLHAKALPLSKLTNLRTYKFRTIIRGDEKFPAISLASIVAKVARDRIMKKLDKKFPEYGFASHKGYGTRAHMEALRKHGPCMIHRKTFIE